MAPDSIDPGDRTGAPSSRDPDQAGSLRTGGRKLPIEPARAGVGKGLDEHPRGPRPLLRPTLSRLDFLQATGLAGAGLVLPGSVSARPVSGEAAPTPAAAAFAVTLEDGAVTSLKFTDDPLGTEYVAPDARLGDVIVRYRSEGREWRDLETGAAAARRTVTTNDDASEQTMTVRGAPDTDAPEIEVGFVVEESAVRWRITLRNPGGTPLEIGDLAIPLPINRNRRGRGAGNEGDPSPPVLKHGLVAGDGSFLLWSRGNSVGPYLLMTPDPGTGLEYWEAQGGYRVFIHSAAAGAVAAERGCDWRQSNTSLALPPGEERF